MPAAALHDVEVITAQQRRFWQIEMQLPDFNKTCHLLAAPTHVAVLSAATGGDLARSRRWDELLRPGGLVATQDDVVDLVIAVADGTFDEVGEIAKRLEPWA